MALTPSPIRARGAPSELMAGLARWRRRAETPQPLAHHKQLPATPEADATKRAFRHWKNTETGRWNPPRYSLRRQAQLVRAAFVANDEHAVAASPKYAPLAARLSQQPHHEVLAPVPSVRLPRLSKTQDAEEALRIAKKAHDRGPYAGRSDKRMFKGTHADRAARLRAARVAENLSKMDSIVAEWRQEKTVAKNKLKPTSPL